MRWLDRSFFFTRRTITSSSLASSWDATTPAAALATSFHHLHHHHVTTQLPQQAAWSRGFQTQSLPAVHEPVNLFFFVSFLFGQSESDAERKAMKGRDDTATDCAFRYLARGGAPGPDMARARECTSSELVTRIRACFASLFR